MMLTERRRQIRYYTSNKYDLSLNQNIMPGERLNGPSVNDENAGGL